jgi:hypothetical protein
LASEIRRPGLLLALLLPLLLAASVYHSDEQALALVFPDATRVAVRSVLLDDAQRAEISRLVGYPIRERTVVQHEGWRGDQLLGRAYILEEIGKTLPFRFLVAIRPDGSVDQVLLLAYREPRGFEIERDAFRQQYRGKSLADPIRRGADIRNVSGATLSVDALSRGVRRALAIDQVVERAAKTP